MTEGEQLGAELFELWRAGEILLPLAAAPYAQASHDLYASALRLDGDLDETTMTLVRSLYAVLQEAIASTGDSLVASGSALVAISEAYAAQDADAGAVLKQLVDQRQTNADGMPTERPKVLPTVHSDGSQGPR